jgi:histidinol phosphatase-like PHP family hydrolase
MIVRLTRKAKTINARADERRRTETTAKLCKEQGQKLVVSTKARTR